MKDKIEYAIHVQKLIIIIDLYEKLFSWIQRDTSMLTMPNLKTKLASWIYILYFFTSTFDYQISDLK